MLQRGFVRIRQRNHKTGGGQQLLKRFTFWIGSSN
jgi:hypothetical protein